MNYTQEIDNFIKNESEDKLKDFHKKLVQTKYEISGIKTPKLHAFAKLLAKEHCPLDEIKPETHEKILLRGLTLAYSKLSEKETIQEFKKFYNKIDNWATCDMIVGALKVLKGGESYEFFTQLLKNSDPFKIRIGVIGLMNYFLSSSRLDEINKNLVKIKNDNYYVKMAVAWLLCTLCCKNFDYGYQVIQKFDDKFTRNKAISKCHDSFRLTKEQKEKLKELRI